MNPLLLFFTIAMSYTNTNLIVKSSAFAHNNYIPFRYTCDGVNINPALIIENIPKNTKCFALIMDDTDSPNGEFTHWVMWNIPPKKNINENSAPGVQGRNSRLENKYYGPCPPNGMHKYHFKVYALDANLDLSLNTDKNDLLKSMEGHILSSGELIGLYYRH
ncbi:MAG: YbhB/YbcL family Raf kinase inhibitor-like protein [Bacteroidota bacterium]|nr:YbhB/YbcL family Raf kinase inhibitor-like protein [Bacteroidota bacterium]